MSMRASLLGLLLVALAATATAQGFQGPGDDGRLGDQPRPNPKPEPRPAPLPAVISMTSLDYALPKLTDEERAFALTDGYIYTVGPTRFMYKGQGIDEPAFMRAIGMDSYADSMKSFETWNTAWIAAACALAAGLTTEFLIPKGTTETITGLEIGTAIGLCISFTGGSIHYLQKPSRPYFQSVAYRANETNRRLLAEKQIKR
jgi:hypothetical protein